MSEIINAKQINKPKWIKSQVLWQCSECGMRVMTDNYNYCPQCGLKMEKEKDHIELSRCNYCDAAAQPIIVNQYGVDLYGYRCSNPMCLTNKYYFRDKPLYSDPEEAKKAWNELQEEKHEN